MRQDVKLHTDLGLEFGHNHTRVLLVTASVFTSLLLLLFSVCGTHHTLCVALDVRAIPDVDVE